MLKVSVVFGIAPYRLLIFAVMSESIKIFTDGSAKGNPGRGGYGIVLKFKGKDKEVCEGFRMTTNNRMELLGVIVALEMLKTNHHPVEIYSDSKYVVDAIEKKWVFNWEKKNFKGKKNIDLWKRYLPLHAKFNPKFHWVKGHAGHPENERCDKLAFDIADSGNLNVDFEYEKINKDI